MSVLKLKRRVARTKPALGFRPPYLLELMNKHSELASIRRPRKGTLAMGRRLTAILQREGDGFVALCPELDVASQGESIEAARENLREALELFFECAAPGEVQDRMSNEVFVTQVEVAVG